MSIESVPVWPRISSVVRADGTGEVVVNGAVNAINASSLEEARRAVVAIATDTARRLARPVRVQTSNPDGDWPIIVRPDGTVFDDEARPTDGAALNEPEPLVDAERSETAWQTPEAAPVKAADPPNDAREPNALGTSADFDDATSDTAPVRVIDSVPRSDASSHAEGPADGLSPTSATAAVEDPYAPRSSDDASRPIPHAPDVASAPGAPAEPHAAPTQAPRYDAPAQRAQPAEPASAQFGAPESFQQPNPESPQPQFTAASASPTPTRRELRQSFLKQERIEAPASTGWRHALAKIGIRMSADPSEIAEREDQRAVAQHWSGPRTVAVVNGKGGVGKTMTTINLSAVFARNGGAGVLAWDNNQTRGTLGWSTEQGPHDASILDLLPQVSAFLGPNAQAADLARYVHHQTSDRFDVLRSKPEVLATQQRFDDETVDSIHRVAAKFYRMIVVDSGNDETDPMWLRAVELSSQLVVPTIGDAKAAESAALLLEGLSSRGGRFAELASNAVVIVSQHKSDISRAEIQALHEGFQPMVRSVVTIPYDAALGADLLTFEAQRAATRRAWLAAGAAVARGL